MKCKEIELLLAEYYDNSLDLDERKRVGQHLAECESCRLRLKEIKQIYQLLEKESVPSPEESFWTNFLPQVRSRIQSEGKSKLTLFPKPRLAFGLMSVVVVAVLSFFLFTMDKRNMEKLRIEPMVETILPESDLSSYTNQLAEALSHEGEVSVDVFLSNDEGQKLELTEKILEEDYLSQKNLNSILSELNLEELKQLEENIKTIQIKDVL